MAKVASSYMDNKGKLHASPDAATISDLAALLSGDAEGMSTGIARQILSNRKAIEEIFADHDRMLTSVRPIAIGGARCQQ